MAMLKQNETWKQIKGFLKTTLPESEYRTWFSPIRLAQLTERVAVLRVPNKFFALWIQDHYLKQLYHSIHNVLDTSPEIRFVFENNASLTSPQTYRPSKQTSPAWSSHLDAAMSFQRFITSESNTFAYTSCKAVVKNPDPAYNPLYLFSPVSTGKTHLLHAIGNQFLAENPLSRILYRDSESFMAEFVSASKNKNLPLFREKYDELDLLLFDDAHLLTKRKKTQDEFLFIFDTLRDSNKQIVIAADQAPNKLSYVRSQLQSRLGSGLLVEIQSPDQEMKVDILKQKVRDDQVLIPDDVIVFIAKRSHDIKILLKNLVRLETYASLHQGEITISMVKPLIRESHKIDTGVHEIQSITAGYFNISRSDLISKNRQRIYAYPRQIAMYLCRQYTDLSYQDIGSFFGQKDHSTVIYAVKRIGSQKDKHPEIRNDLNNIEKLFT